MASVNLTRRRFVSASLGAVAPGALQAQSGGSFPDRTLHLIVPASPGGVQDVHSRRLAARLGVALKQQVLVENKPGGGMSVAMQTLKQSAPDGYTMLMASVQMTIQTHLLKLAYDPLHDIDAVTLFTFGPLVLVAPAGAPFSTLDEMLVQARTRRGSMGVAGFGMGSLAHLAVLLLNRNVGTWFTHIPYAGGGQQVSDLIGGQVPLLFDFAPVLRQHLQAGRMKALAVAGERRLAVLPDVPTFVEQGVSGMVCSGWQGVVVPAGTPEGVVLTLNAHLVKVLQEPDHRASYIDEGAEVGGNTPESFATLIRSEHARWGQLIRESGLRLE